MLTRALLMLLPAVAAFAFESPAIGTRLELFTDASMIERITGGARRQLHSPEAREVSLTMDKPWEGNAVNYVTVFQDGSLYRMYYRGADVVYSTEGYKDSHREITCYAESRDGIRSS